MLGSLSGNFFFLFSRKTDDIEVSEIINNNPVFTPLCNRNRLINSYIVCIFHLKFHFIHLNSYKDRMVISKGSGCAYQLISKVVQ